jgi:hypothetical protein
MEVRGQLHVPAVLPPEKEPLAPIGQDAGWAPGLVWMLWQREKFPATARIQTPDHPAHSPALYQNKKNNRFKNVQSFSKLQPVRKW